MSRVRARENEHVTHVHVVYAHPSDRGFTREILDAFLGGLEEAGHTYTVSDLYVMGFRWELTVEEYERESGDGDGAERWVVEREGHLARAAALARSI